MPDISAIIAYEQGDLNEDQTIALFQELVDTGMAWRLQGHYGRTAYAMVDAGLVTLPGHSPSVDFSSENTCGHPACHPDEPCVFDQPDPDREV